MDAARSVTATFSLSGGTTTTFEQRVAASSDDAEQNLATGSVGITSSDLELTVDGSANQAVGLRFTGVAIPPGAAILNAWVQFKVDQTGSSATSLSIQGQAADNPPTFTTSVNNVTSRPLTTASVGWLPAPWPVVGQSGPDQQTPNLASVIQEIVSRPGWLSGNSLVLVITGSGARVAESFNGDAPGAALLHVEYGGGGGPSFSLSVSKNGTGSGTVASSPAGITCGPTCSAPFNSNTVVTLNHSADSGSTFAGWGGACTGTGTCLVTMDAAKAVIATFTLSGGAATTFEQRVLASSDDAEQNLSSGSVNLTSSDLEMMIDGSVNQAIGIRFTGVTIPRGAAIVNAWVQFKADNATSAATSLNFQGQAADNSPTFTTSANDVTSRPRTLASVNWVPAAWTSNGQAGPAQQTPNLASVIQEIVSRPGWVSGSSLALIVTGSGTRRAQSFNGDAPGAPLLHVEYNLPSP